MTLDDPDLASRPDPLRRLQGTGLALATATHRNRQTLAGAPYAKAAPTTLRNEWPAELEHPQRPLVPPLTNELARVHVAAHAHLTAALAERQ